MKTYDELLLMTNNYQWYLITMFNDHIHKNNVQMQVAEYYLVI